MIINNGFLCVCAGEAFASVCLRSLLSLLLGGAAAVSAGVLRDFFLPLRLLAVPVPFEFGPAVMVMVMLLMNAKILSLL